MNLCAGSDPSLNFPKPFTFSPGYKITKQPNPNNHRLFDLSTLANNVAIGGHCHLLPFLLTYLPYYPIIFTHPPIHHSPFTIIQSSTSRWVIGYNICEIAYIASASTLIILLTQTTSALPPRLDTLSDPIAAGLHRNFIPIWLSYPIEITHTVS